MISVKHTGSFNKTEALLKGAKSLKHLRILHKYGRMGVSALASNTPTDTGLTAGSWDYKISVTRKGFSVSWSNSNLTSSGIPVVVLLQYGHGTRGGGYVQGRDFINPSLQPVFDGIAEDIWREVTKL